MVKQFTQNKGLNKAKNKKAKPKNLSEQKVNELEEDFSEEELGRMLGNSDNSDIDSVEFSEDDEVESKKAAVPKKRKLELDVDKTEVSNKKCKNDQDDSEDDLNDESDDDEYDLEDSFIDDKTDEDDSEDEGVDSDDEDKCEDDEDEDEDNDKDEVTVKKEVYTPKVAVIKQKEIDKKSKQKKPKMDNEEKKPKMDNEEKRPKMDNEALEELRKKIFSNTEDVESETLIREITNRLKDRVSKSIVLNGLVYFDNELAKKIFPELISCIIPYSPIKHKVKGTAYIDFPNAELASSYVKKGVFLKNRKIYSAICKRDEKIENYNCRRLSLSNLSPKTTIGDLKKLFPKAKDINFLPVFPVDRKMNLIAFAEYGCVEDALADYDQKHGLNINGQPVYVKFQQRTDKNKKDSKSTYDYTKLVVLGIKKNIKDESVKSLFPQATSVKIARGNGTAFVDYDNESECKIDKISAMKNNLHLRVYFKDINRKQQVSYKPKQKSKEQLKEIQVKKKARNEKLQEKKAKRGLNKKQKKHKQEPMEISLSAENVSKGLKIKKDNSSAGRTQEIAIKSEKTVDQSAFPKTTSVKPIKEFPSKQKIKEEAVINHKKNVTSISSIKNEVQSKLVHESKNSKPIDINPVVQKPSQGKSKLKNIHHKNTDEKKLPISNEAHQGLNLTKKGKHNKSKDKGNSKLSITQIESGNESKVEIKLPKISDAKFESKTIIDKAAGQKDIKLSTKQLKKLKKRMNKRNKQKKN